MESKIVVEAEEEEAASSDSSVSSCDDSDSAICLFSESSSSGVEVIDAAEFKTASAKAQKKKPDEEKKQPESAATVASESKTPVRVSHPLAQSLLSLSSASGTPFRSSPHSTQLRTPNSRMMMPLAGDRMAIAHKRTLSGMQSTDSGLASNNINNVALAGANSGGRSVVRKKKRTASVRRKKTPQKKTKTSKPKSSKLKRRKTKTVPKRYKAMARRLKAKGFKQPDFESSPQNWCAVCVQVKADASVRCALCHMKVHLQCFGVDTKYRADGGRTADTWYCDVCQFVISNAAESDVVIDDALAEKCKSYKAAVECVICNTIGIDGALKRVRRQTAADKVASISSSSSSSSISSDGAAHSSEVVATTADTKAAVEWAHVSCAQWNVGPKFGDPVTMHPIEGVDLIDDGFRKMWCVYCEEATGGACLQCEYGQCRATYHAPCIARSTGSMLMNEIGDKIYTSTFCSLHLDPKFRIQLDRKLGRYKAEASKK